MTTISRRTSFSLAIAAGICMPMGAMAQQATELERLEVEGVFDDGEGPFTGYAPEASVSATKGEAPLIETPQAVSVIGSEQIEDQGARTVTEAARYSPGIRAETFGNDVRNDWFLIRGFSSQVSSYFLDGLQLQSSDSFATWKMNPFLLERIDILRGPSSALYGSSNPGGLINMVSKRPTGENRGEVSIGVNEHGNVWSGIDVERVAEGDGDWQMRLVATGNGGDTEVDFTDDNQFAVMPTLTWSPDEDTSLTLYAHYSMNETNSQNFLPYEGTAVRAPFGYIPRDLFTSEPDLDYFEREQAMAGYEFEHSFNENVTVRQNLRYSHISVDIVGAYGLGWVTPPTETSAILDRGAFETHPDLGLFNVDNQVEVKAETGPLQHTMLFGLDYKYFDLHDEQAYGDATDFDVLDPSYDGSFTIPPLAISDTTQRQIGLYAQDTIKFDRLSFVVSGRYDDVSAERDAAGTITETSDDAFSGRAGVVYNFDNGFAPYASISRSFLPLIGTDDVTGEPLAPETGVQYEAGFRYQPAFMNGGYVGASVFDLTRENFVTSDGVNFTRQIGEINSRGFEIEAAGQITPDLKLIGAYTWYDLEITEGNPVEIGNVTPATPEQFGSLWLDYTVPDARFEGLSLGAGVRYIGSSFADGANTLEVDDVVLVDAAIRYDRDNLGAALNVSNLFDEEYVASCNVTCFYGESREVKLTLSYKW